MKNSHIGIFDSGIGGLTVVKALMKVLPKENIVYFGDTKHLPYGEKSIKSIQEFSTKIINFLVSKKCKIIIIACNSASSAVAQSIAKTAYNIPILNVIDPVIKEVVKVCSNNIGVIGTKATISSNIYEKKIKLLDNNANINSLATPLLAPMIEEEFINEKISSTIITNYLSDKRLTNISHLILACTHYPLIQQEISDYYKNKVTVIDSATIVAKYIALKLKKLDLLRVSTTKNHHFYVSNYTDSFEKSANFFLKKSIKLKEVDIFS